MKPLSSQVYNFEEKFQQTVEVKDRVDINALFESQTLSPKLLTENKPQSSPVEQYNVENEVNREQRHAFLKKVRVTRALFLMITLLVVFFFIGIILTISGAFYLQNNYIDIKYSNSDQNMSSDTSNATSNAISEKISITSTQRNTSTKEVIKLFNEVHEDSKQEFGNHLSDNDMKSHIDSNGDLFDDQLHELVPDSETNEIIKGLLNDVTTDSNEYLLEDLPSTLLDIGRFFGRIFNRVRSDFNN